MMLPAWVMLLLSMRAMPKSAILSWPDGVTMMLAGLMSRWMTPLLWLKARPVSRSVHQPPISSRLAGVPASVMVLSVSPSTNSMTMKARSFVSP